MDYPQLNLIFGLILMFTLVVNISLRVLLSKMRLSPWSNRLSGVALAINIMVALYIEALFLRLMTPTFNWQITLGLLFIGGVGAVVTAMLYRRVSSSPLANLLLGAQILISLVSLAIAFGLYRNLVPLAGFSG